ncbi:MAG: alpha/beta fold hydrolase [Limisphaerales bacterium]
MAFVIVGCGSRGAEDELRRQAMFGAVLEEAKDGVLLKRILAGSSAAEGGFQKGDVVKSLGERKINDIPSLLAALAGRRAGDRVVVGYQRDGQSKQVSVTLKEKIREQGKGYEVIYGSVKNGDFRQRTIATRPRGEGRHPAVLFLQGGHTCFPVDDIIGRPSAFVRITQHLARHGYVTMRVERPGCGDSEGGPLRDIDFTTELAGNIAAVRALKQNDYVDPDKVLIYGLSMGGFFAPLIAREEPVRGIAAYGTTCGTFFEGVTGQRRRFLLLAGKSPAQVNRENLGHIRFWYQLTVEGKTMREILDSKLVPQSVLDQWAGEPPYVAGRNESFYHQIADQNLAEMWGKVAQTPLPGAGEDRFPRVLALLGEFDWHTTHSEGADWIVQTVNAASPGQATKVVVPQSDHFSNHVKSAKESFAVLYGKQPRPTAPFNPAILGILLKWCDATVGKAKH